MMWETWLIAFWILLLGMGWYPCCCEDEAGLGDNCSGCVDDETYIYMTAVLTGMANRDCDGCDEYNGTHVLTQSDGNACAWLSGYWYAPVCSADNRLSITVRIIGFTDPTNLLYEATISLGDTFSHDGVWSLRGPVQNDDVRMECLSEDGTGDALLDYHAYWSSNACYHDDAELELYSGDTT